MSLCDVEIETDVLVIGGGLAGCRAALRARELGARVALVERAKIGRSGGSLNVSVQLAPWRLTLEEKRSWLAEIVENTNYLADQDHTSAVLDLAPTLIDDLRNWGVPFEVGEDGRLKYVIARGNKVCRSVAGDGTKMMEVLAERVKDKGVQVFERVSVYALLTEDGLLPTFGSVVGAIGYGTRTGRFHVFKAKAVVLATGPNTQNAHFNYGITISSEGPMMGFRAGATLSGMEFCTRGFFNYWLNRFQASGQSRLVGMGARLINARGERIMSKYDPEMMEMGSQPLLVNAIAIENLEGRGPCYFDMTHFSEDDVQTLGRIVPAFANAFSEAGFDIRKEPTLTHAYLGIGSSGGLVTDLDGQTNVPNLFASGLTALDATMVSGTFGGTSATFSNFSGYRAGQMAAEVAGRTGATKVCWDQAKRLRDEAFGPLDRDSSVTPQSVYQRIISKIMPAPYSLFKNGNRLRETLAALSEIEADLLPRISAPDIHELAKANQVVSLLRLVQCCNSAALYRAESRGPHYRADFPFRDDEKWLKWLLLGWNGDKINIAERPLPFEHWPIRPTGEQKFPAKFKLPAGLSQ